MSNEANRLYYLFIVKQEVHKALVFFRTWVFRDGMKRSRYFRKDETIIANVTNYILRKYPELKNKGYIEEEMFRLFNEFTGDKTSNADPLGDGSLEMVKWYPNKETAYQNPKRRAFIEIYGRPDVRDFLPLHPNMLCSFYGAIPENGNDEPIILNYKDIMSFAATHDGSFYIMSVSPSQKIKTS